MADLETSVYKRQQNGKDFDSADMVHGYLDPVAEAEIQDDFMYGLRVEDSESHEIGEFTQFIADLMQDGDGASAAAEIEAYLRQVRAAEVELEGQHPRFSEVVEIWVRDELSKRQTKFSRLDDLTHAEIYRKLHDELQSEYEEGIAANDSAAIAEWAVVSQVVDQRIKEHTLLDMSKTVKDKFDLAA